MAEIDAGVRAAFANETELLGLDLLPGQAEAMLASYAALREMVKIVGADYPLEAEPGHIFSPLPSGVSRRA